jgi:uncharacterized FAD-dependent dehydrogenase
MFSFVLDATLPAAAARRAFGRVKDKPGRMRVTTESPSPKLRSPKPRSPPSFPPRAVTVVGAGPAGLFAAFLLSHLPSLKVVLLEQGQPVESRGRDIGALTHRKLLDPLSNYAFGEGGAGTWSDGKLTTRIGRNSAVVRFVLRELVGFGAPARILEDGAPHLGTDNLVKLLRNMREEIRERGGEIRFGARVVDLEVGEGGCGGVKVE